MSEDLTAKIDVAVESIVSDLRGRGGLRQGWDEIDDDIQEEIREEWRDAIRKAMED